jgi:predicted PurR-regulated permease PerM
LRLVAAGPVLTPFVVAAVLAYALTPWSTGWMTWGVVEYRGWLAVIWWSCCSLLVHAGRVAADRAHSGQGAAADA